MLRALLIIAAIFIIFLGLSAIIKRKNRKK